MNEKRPNTILVADSDENARYLLGSLLELRSFEVCEAQDGQDAIDAAQRKLPDLILIQLKLPVVSGFTAIRRIRKIAELKEVAIIAFSSNDPASNHDLAIAAGCNAHLENPIDFEVLDQLIEELFPGHSLALV